MTSHLIALFLLSLLLYQAHTQCNDYCYIKQSIQGKCTICYNDCENSPQASFKSCSITPNQDTQNYTISEALCKTQCYPQTYLFLKSQPQNTEKAPEQVPIPEPQQTFITLQELQKLKRETEGWTPQQQKLLKTFLIMFGSSLFIIVGFSQIWRVVDKKRKLKELQQKQQKQWVKCFQKVNTSDTTICSIDSKQTTNCIGQQKNIPNEQ